MKNARRTGDPRAFNNVRGILNNRRALSTDSRPPDRELFVASGGQQAEKRLGCRGRLQEHQVEAAARRLALLLPASVDAIDLRRPAP
jgi:hypothetical protein